MADHVDSVTTLPPIQRYITSHNAEGKSIYVESPTQKYVPYPGAGGYSRSYSVIGAPAQLEGETDIKAYLATDTPVSWTNPAITTEGTSTLLVVDLIPGGASLMHQTVSIDFGVVVIGQILHELDSGEVKLLNPGDHIVQRGTNHLWRNASQTEPARFICVTLAAVPWEINGKLLEEKHGQ